MKIPPLMSRILWIICKIRLNFGIDFWLLIINSNGKIHIIQNHLYTSFSQLFTCKRMKMIINLHDFLKLNPLLRKLSTLFKEVVDMGHPALLGTKP